MTSYVDTLVIDCNRRTSEQTKSITNPNTDPAVFTCRQGSGIKLNPGDEVSLHSAMVNEKGNNGNVEFNGKVIDGGEADYTLEQTILHTYFDTSDGTSNGYGNQLYYPFNQATSVVNQKKTFQLKDNEANIQTSYYKTSNGQGYYHLPRRVDMDPIHPGKGVSQFDDEYQMYKAFVGLAGANPIPAGVKHDAYNLGLCRCPPDEEAQCPADWQYYSFGAGQRTDSTTGTMGWKRKNDNSRYTIYLKTRQYWDSVAVNSTDLGGGSSPLPAYAYDPDTGFYTEGASSCDELITATAVGNPSIDYTPVPGRDPATMATFVRYKEIKNLKISEGYSTPTELAEQITDQLNKTFEPVPVEVLLDRSNPAPSNLPCRVSVKQSSECLKPFHSSNHDTMNADTFTAYRSGADGAWLGVPGNINGNNHAIKQSQNTYCIGVKRPELWDAGRSLYDDQIVYPGTMKISDTFRGSARLIEQWHIHPLWTILFGYTDPSPLVVTTIPWTDLNLQNLIKYFQAQAKYPDLFDYKFNYRRASGVPATDYESELKPTNSCFLHIDIRGSTKATSDRYLGSDNYESSAEATAYFGDDDSNASFPIWFDFQPWDVNISEPQDLENDKLTYGYFKRYEDGLGNYWVGFRSMGGIPDYLFDHSPNAQIDETMTIGHDWHFDAYGTDCISLYSGYLNADYDGKTEYAGCDRSTSALPIPDTDYKSIYPYQRDYYCGSNQVEVGFDVDAGRFYIHQLHSPELVGNDYSAGSINTDPPVVDAGDQVYKVNKRLGGYNFTPTMVPYEPAVDSSNDHPAVPGAKIPLSFFNWNFQPWTIYDSDSGIFIEDFGVAERYWDRCLWGKLGFTFKQFDVSENTLSRQTRLNDLVKVDEIGAITTNANVLPGDMTQWTTNAFSAEMEVNMLPSIMFAFLHQNAPAGDQKPTLPAITTKQTSVKITADNLPTKMENAYYLIRSDIISDTNYMVGDEAGDGQLMPIVGVVNKENGFGDYYFQTGTQLAFTITQPRVITSITTSIHDPDMRTARVDNNSAVLYKITKNNNGNYLIGDELIKKAKSK